MIAELNVLITLVITSLGFSLNFLLIWMILHHTQSEMRAYSRILLQTCITDVLTISINFFVQPVSFWENGYDTVWSYGPAHFLPNPWHYYCLNFHAFMTRLTSTGVCSLFIYRYFLVNRGIEMSWKAYCCLITVVAMPSVFLFICALTANAPTPENEHLTNQTIITILGLDNATVQNHVVPLRSDRYLSALSTFTVYFTLGHKICSFIVILLCGLAVQLHIIRKFRGPSMIIKRRINSQITVLFLIEVIIQATLTPIASFLSQFPGNIKSAFSLSLGPLLIYIGFFKSTFLVIVAVINPLSTLFFIKTYRRVLFKWFCCEKQTAAVNGQQLMKTTVVGVTNSVFLPSPVNVVVSRSNPLMNQAF